MPGKTQFVIQAVLLLAIGGCNAGPDLEADRAELLRLHDLERQAHMEKRADELVAAFSDSFRDVSRGEVTQPAREVTRSRFQAYFDRTTFLVWEDVEPPIIRISPDGRMAYVIVQKDVHVSAPDRDGTPVEEHKIYAWLETYEKENGAWRLTTVASTDRPASKTQDPATDASPMETP
jgi:hypothetical protein